MSDIGRIAREADDIFVAAPFVQAIEQHPILGYIHDKPPIQNIADDVIDQINCRDPLAGWLKRRNACELVGVCNIDTLRTIAAAGDQRFERVARLLGEQCFTNKLNARDREAPGVIAGCGFLQSPSMSAHWL